MALFIQQTVAAKQAITAQATTQIKQTKLINSIVTVSALIGMLSLSACQTAPTVMKTSPVQTLPSVTKQPSTATQAPIVKNSTHATSPYESNDYEDEAYEYPIEPYTPPEQPTATNPLTEATPVYTPSTQSPIVTQPDSPDAIILTPSREDYMISEPSIPSHNELLERARQNSQQRSQQSTANNSNLPAFRNLMQTGTEQLKSGNLNAAESSFTRAQRLAPKSSAVYFYLAQVALKKNQPRKAEAMARRGLTVAQDSTRRRNLWQIILQSGQAQGNARVINEARQALR